MSREKQIESTDWLTKGIPQDQLEREKIVATMSVDLLDCHTEFTDGNGDIYTDYDVTAEKMVAKGYRKQSEGEWGYDEGCDCFVCNVCYHSALNNYRGLSVNSKYCPNCGAKMKGGVE